MISSYGQLSMSKNLGRPPKSSTIAGPLPIEFGISLVFGFATHDKKMSDKQLSGSTEGASYEDTKGGTIHQSHQGSASIVPILAYRKAGESHSSWASRLRDDNIRSVVTPVRLPDSNPLGRVGPDAAVFGLAFFFGGMSQIIAGIMAFTTGNTYGTTVHISYGSFWLSYTMFLIPSLGIKDAYAGDQRAFSFALGIYLVFWCLLTLMFLVASLRTNYATLGVFGLLVPAFFFLALANFLRTTHMDHAIRLNKTGGVFSFLCAFVAFYAGAAGLMAPETTFVHLPLGEMARPDESSVA
ncbi:Gpr1 family protein [Blastomyces gilchristii SLH14081]|uniref:Gpr1 family protein n=1 Tax=Blastomyces gilchristii (strain SLH14081) TaxID=559298 RepID=A0A179V4M4_BLAGS|nr:Gpr1 family protein [Blastomyces gilchristii SLH14081]OAT14399.1 Gpr1 family protein [Blastomyces gilchristii SLH14081]